MQYTIRGIPRAIDAALRRRARAERRSLNAVAVDALASGAGLHGHRNPCRDLKAVVGTWQENSAFDAALDAQDQVDETLWR
jgi:hypothetical protein